MARARVEKALARLVEDWTARWTVNDIQRSSAILRAWFIRARGISIMRPLSLSDDQMDAVMRAAAPLHPVDRGPFLERIAERLRGIEILGNGLVSRIAREVQREFFRPPDLGNPRRAGVGKYR